MRYVDELNARSERLIEHAAYMYDRMVLARLANKLAQAQAMKAVHAGIAERKRILSESNERSGTDI